MFGSFSVHLTKIWEANDSSVRGNDAAERGAAVFERTGGGGIKTEREQDGVQPGPVELILHSYTIYWLSKHVDEQYEGRRYAQVHHRHQEVREVLRVHYVLDLVVLHLQELSRTNKYIEIALGEDQVQQEAVCYKPHPEYFE